MAYNTKIWNKIKEHGDRPSKEELDLHKLNFSLNLYTALRVTSDADFELAVPITDIDYSGTDVAFVYPRGYDADEDKWTSVCFVYADINWEDQEFIGRDLDSLRKKFEKDLVTLLPQLNKDTTVGYSVKCSHVSLWLAADKQGVGVRIYRDCHEDFK